MTFSLAAKLAEKALEITWEEGVIGSICIILGLFLVFYGFRYFSPAIFCTGFFLGYVIMYSILINAKVTDELPLILGSIATGIVLGLVLVWMIHCVAKIVLFLLGFLAGFMLCIWAMSWSETILITSDAWRWVAIVAVAIVIGLFAICLRKIFIIVCTSWYGAFYVFYGIDLFAKTGFSEAFQDVLSGDPQNSEFSNAIYAMLVCDLVLFGLGVGVQFCITSRDHEYDPVEEGNQKI